MPLNSCPKVSRLKPQAAKPRSSDSPAEGVDLAEDGKEELLRALSLSLNQPGLAD
jgi:hypothetical protein